MASIRITKRLVDTARVGATQTFVWDSVVRGFGLRITSAGIKSYVLQYRLVGGRGTASRRYTIGKHGSPWTAESARAEAERLLREIKAGRDPAAVKAAKRTAPTINDLCDEYLAEGTAAKKPSTLRVDKGRIQCHIRPLLGQKRVEDLSQADVERFLLDVKNGKTAISEPRNDDERKPGSLPKGGSGAAAQSVILLGAMLSFAVRRGMRSDNPAHGVKKPKVRKMERFLCETEIGALAKAIRHFETRAGNPHIAAAIRLLLLTGCRKSELLSLRWENVDLKRACIMLPDSKTGRKPIYLNEPAIGIFKSIPRIDGNPYVIVGAKAGSCLVNIDKAWVEIRATARLPSLRLHDLRHSFASVAVAGGMSLPIIGALLGHRESSTTSRYAHLADDPLRAANEIVGSRIAAAMGPKRIAIKGRGTNRVKRIRAKKAVGAAGSRPVTETISGHS